MIQTTTNNIEGKVIDQYLGIISAQVIIGANFMKDIFGGLRDFFGGRSNTYEKVFDDARAEALNELEQKARYVGANAVLGIKIDFETVGPSGSMMMVTATGTAVIYR